MKIVHGFVEQPSPPSLGEVAAAYEANYAWRLEPEDPSMPFFRPTPRRVLAWRAEDIRGTSARWDF